MIILWRQFYWLLENIDLQFLKKCIANIDRVIIKTNEGKTGISFLDLYDEYLVEDTDANYFYKCS
jgi:hypothetical protein